MNHAMEKAINESSRALAVEILGRVDAEGGYANLLLNQRLRTVKLSSSDAGFLTELVSGTLRERQFYDAVIEQASQRPTDSIDPLTLNILRTGAHQLLTLHTGAHAAVNESVELQRALGKQSATGFVNGVLQASTVVTPWAGEADVMREWRLSFFDLHNTRGVMATRDGKAVQVNTTH
jgi:16S rRNA (cytosine967-C5)-methyltransferase